MERHRYQPFTTRDGSQACSRCHATPSDPVHDIHRYEPRQDDDQPISEEWFENQWPDDERPDCYAVECPVGWFEVLLYGESCFGFHLAGGEFDGDRLQTRGDVRRLLWYLEAEVIP